VLEHSTQPLRPESLAANTAPDLGILGSDNSSWPPNPLEPANTSVAAGGLPSTPDTQTGLTLPTTAPSELGQTLDPVVDAIAGATLPEGYAGGDPLTNPRNLNSEALAMTEPVANGESILGGTDLDRFSSLNRRRNLDAPPQGKSPNQLKRLIRRGRTYSSWSPGW
jgi:hypothetical protein